MSTVGFSTGAHTRLLTLKFFTVSCPGNFSHSRQFFGTHRSWLIFLCGKEPFGDGSFRSTAGSVTGWMGIYGYVWQKRWDVYKLEGTSEKVSVRLLNTQFLFELKQYLVNFWKIRMSLWKRFMWFCCINPRPDPLADVNQHSSISI